MTQTPLLAGEERVLAVSELIACLRETLEDEFGDVWVEGEIGSLHRSRAGHLYFDLKDPEGLLRVAMFRLAAGRLRVQPEEGMQVRVHARVDLYAERGALQLVADHLEPCGEGALRIAFERLKARLDAEGLFDPAHKRPLPFLPHRIGLVTSRHGAALHDFLRGLRRRHVPADVLLFDARVQGEGAWREVVRGLHLLDADPSVDLIVLARGGGSIEDLWTFNREELVRAVFEAETPVVSAIGHAIDWVLTDLVADGRAATPTAAAELVTPDGAHLGLRIGELGSRLAGRQRLRLRELTARVDALRRGVRHPGERLREIGRRAADLGARLPVALRRMQEGLAARLDRCERGLRAGVLRTSQRRDAELATVAARLEALSPLAVLGRGYSITRRQGDRAILKDARDVETGQGISVQLSRGELLARVLERTEEG